MGEQAASTPARHHERSTPLSARGEPSVWLTGAALVVCMVMVVGLLTLTVIKGLATFWPRPIELVVQEIPSADPDAAPTIVPFVGQPMDEEWYRPQEDERAFVDAARASGDTLDGAFDDQGRPMRRLYRIGNRDIDPQSFKWVPVYQIRWATRDPVSRFTLSDGTMVYGVRSGEPRAVEPSQEQAAEIERLAQAGELEDGVVRGGQPLAVRVQVADESLGEEAFRDIPLYSIERQTTGEFPVKLEREEWGVWYGFPRALVDAERVVLAPDEPTPDERIVETAGGPQRVVDVVTETRPDGSRVVQRQTWRHEGDAQAVWAGLKSRWGKARDRLSKIESLKDHDTGSVATRLERERLRLRSAELERSRASNADDSGPVLSPFTFIVVLAAAGGALSSALGLGRRITRKKFGSRRGEIWLKLGSGLSWIAAAALLIAAWVENPWGAARTAPEWALQISAAANAQDERLRAEHAEARLRIGESETPDALRRAFASELEAQHARIDALAAPLLARLDASGAPATKITRIKDEVQGAKTLSREVIDESKAKLDEELADEFLTMFDLRESADQRAKASLEAVRRAARWSASGDWFERVRLETETKQAELAAEYQGILAEIRALQAEDSAERIAFVDPKFDAFAPVSQTQPDQPMRMSQIVRWVETGTLSFGGKLSVYLDRWLEYIFGDPREANTEGGIFPVIIGTVVLTILLSVAVVPLGVVAALYMREYAKQGLMISMVRIAVNNLAGVPSIVYGVFGLGFFCYMVGGYIDTGPADPMPRGQWWVMLLVLGGVVLGAGTMVMLARARPGADPSRLQKFLSAASAWTWGLAVVGVLLIIWHTPYFTGFFEARSPNSTFRAKGMLWSALTLALLTLPVVIVATEEAIAAVPRSMREGSYGCGASKWQTIRRIVLPRAMPGIMTGMILAMARGAGEVAPLMLVGAVKLQPELPIQLDFPFLHLERSFMHLGFHIYDVGFQSPDSEAARPLVWTTTFLLIMIVLVLNMAAIRIRAGLRKKFIGGAF